MKGGALPGSIWEDVRLIATTGSNPPVKIQFDMITNNVIQRVFRIQAGLVTGSAFALDYAGRQYCITARHLFEKTGPPNAVRIYHDGQWKDLPVTLVGFGANDIDIAVLAPTVQLAPTYPLEPMTGLTIGQQVFFLGFPLGMMSVGSEINREFPIPLVKSGVFSGAEGKPLKTLWVDGHNNPGFSGGPLVCAKGQASARDYEVAGVISGYRLSMLPVHDQLGNEIGALPENSGIVVAYAIKPAIDLIKANPIGYELADSAGPAQGT